MERRRNPETPATFSPEDAAQIREAMVTPGAELRCPRCGERLTTSLPLAGGGSVAAVWEIRCEACHRTMFVRDLPMRGPEQR